MIAKTLVVCALVVFATGTAAARPAADVSPDGDADAEWVAISATGNSRGFYAISGTGDANGTIPLSVTGHCISYWEYEDPESGQRHAAGRWSPCFAVSSSEDADGHWIGTSTRGDASGLLAVSGSGDTSGSDSCLGAWAVIGSWSCARDYALLSSSVQGDARDGSASASVRGDAEGRLAAVSLFGDADQSGPSAIGLAASVFGRATACEHAPTCATVSAPR